MSRIAPLEPPYAPEIQQQFDRIMRGAPPLLLFRTIAGSARAWEKFRAGSLLDRGPLTMREREIVIDRTCALTGCEYEWGVHITAFAQAAHLTEEQIRVTVLGAADAPCWSPAEQAMLAAVDALHHVEGRAEDLAVGAGDDRLGDAHRLVLDRIEDAVLAQHVVRGRRARVSRRAAQHPSVVAAFDGEHLARPTATHRFHVHG